MHDGVVDERGNGQQGVGCACGSQSSGGTVLELDPAARLVVSSDTSTDTGSDSDGGNSSEADRDSGLAVLDQELARILTVLDGDLAELMDPEASIYDGADSHEERRARQLYAYRDADGQLRTRHGLLTLAR